MRDLQIVNTDQDGSEDTGEAYDSNGNNGLRSVATDALKLQHFNDDKDDLDTYLTRFGRVFV